MGDVLQWLPLVKEHPQCVTSGHLCKPQFDADEGHGAVFPGDVKYMVHLFVFERLYKQGLAPFGKSQESGHSQHILYLMDEVAFF